jgi:hypothetical protein
VGTSSTHMVAQGVTATAAGAPSSQLHSWSTQGVL